jgi:tetratricopeptide (TPR) repeat protein
MLDCGGLGFPVSRADFFVSIVCGLVQHLLTVNSMLTKQIIRAASGWVELGMPADALNELKSLPADQSGDRTVLQLKLSAEMALQQWKDAAETAKRLCMESVDEPDYFLSAAFCLHELGETEEARKWLLRGPEILSEMAVFHYNMACYLWTLGEKERAHNHLAKAFEMDESFKESARHDKDLIGIEL